MADPEAITIGARVGVFHSATSSTLSLYGYGTYQGDEIPPEDILAPWGPAFLPQQPVPKLVLDDGRTVWGCECWWAPEDMVRELAQNLRVEAADLEAARAERRAKWEQANRELDEAEEALP